MFPEAISRARVGRSRSSDGATDWIIEVGFGMEVERTGFSPDLIVVMIEPTVPGVAVLKVGKIWPSPEEIDVVRTSTSAATTEVTIVGGADVADG